MDSEALRRRRRELQASKESVFDPGTNLGVYQPPLGRGATPSLGAHVSAPEAPRFERFADKGRLSLEREWRAEDEGGGRQSPSKRDGGAEGPDHSARGKSEECPDGAGQGKGGCLKDPFLPGISG